MEIAIGIGALVIGAVAGVFFQKSKSEKRVVEVEAKRDELEVLRNELQRQVESLGGKIEMINAINMEKNSNYEERIKQQQKFIEDSQNVMKEQFENIANKQLQDNAKKFFEDSSQNLGNILKPLSENIEKFKKEFADTYSNEARERFALGKEIQRIVEVNSKMTSTTENLTKALRGEKKTQGNWGEVILERLLEEAGLKKDVHFKTQSSYTNEEGKRQLPDVIIHLPESKHIIIDSKVSLISYEKYCSEEADEARVLHSRAFGEAVKNHIKGLSAKNYQTNDNLSTLDFVIMFMPIEGTYQLAAQHDSDIFNFGWNNRVIITSPATLFPILKTITSIWKVDAQNKNTQEIIKTATQLYEKFMNFAENLERVGKSIDSAQSVYKEAVSQFSEGRGNAVSIVRKLEDYGIDKKRGNKKLPAIVQTLADEEEVDNQQELEEAAN